MKVLNTRRKRIIGERVAIPEFEMVSCPAIRIADIRRRRFDIIDRAQDAARREIAAQEDKAIFAAMVSVTRDEIVRSGYIGTHWGVEIIVSRGADFDDEEA